jgi:molybdate transport system permease protein
MNAPMPIDWFPLWLSLRVAALATLIALPVALGLAHLLAKHRFRAKAALEAVITLPLVLPATVLAYYLLVLLGRSSALGRAYESVFGAPLLFTWQAAVVAAWIHATPLLVHSARISFESVDPGLEKAARSLGASGWRVFLRVTLPAAERRILAAVVLAFGMALGDFGVTIMIAGNLAGRTQTMPVAIYSAVESGNGATARALVLVVSAVILGILFLAKRLEPKQVAE